MNFYPINFSCPPKRKKCKRNARRKPAELFVAEVTLFQTLWIKNKRASVNWKSRYRSFGNIRRGERNDKMTMTLSFTVAGSVNEAGVFTLRGRQEGGRRARRTTTTSTTSTTTSSSTLISLSDEVAQPAALLAPEEDLWSTSSSATTNVPVSLDTAAAPSKPPLELVVKPHSKVVLPCELEENYSRLLLPGAR